MSDRRARFELLCEQVRTCTRCPTMTGRPRVLGPRCGPLTARCLVVGEAPGRHGAARRGMPLAGDYAGEAFDELLAWARIDRAELFLTNACLCAPVTADRRHRRPSADELTRCSTYLRAMLELIDPPLVVTLGATALAALRLLAPHRLRLGRDGGAPHRWSGRWLLPLHHPAPRGRLARSLAHQRADYALWRELLDACAPRAVRSEPGAAGATGNVPGAW
ncbi:MAG: hypothetical protein NZ898_03040 [Myxococcota bacterium]|nr:hypothetical protein [Myxococcota bacterium]